MKQEYIVGGWVKMTKTYYSAKKGDVLQILSNHHKDFVSVKCKDGSTVEVNKHTYSPNPECEWVGMENPTEWIPKVGDWVFTTQYGAGVFKILEIKGERIYNQPGGWVDDVSKMRPATPEEIPQQKIKNVETTYKVGEKKEEEWVPKAGDWVEILRGRSNWNNSMDQYVGRVVQLLPYERNKFHIEEDGKTWSWEYKDGHFKKASAPLVTKKDPTVELLEEANRRYKIGDVVLSAYSGAKDTVKYSPKREPGGNISSGGMFYLYYNGKWAEHLKKKEDLLAEAIRRYPIGTRYDNGYGGIAEVEKQTFTMHGDCVAGEGGKGFLYRPQLGWAKIVTAISEKECEQLGEKIRDVMGGVIEKLPSEIIVKKEKKKRKELIFS